MTVRVAQMKMSLLVKDVSSKSSSNSENTNREKGNQGREVKTREERRGETNQLP